MRTSRRAFIKTSTLGGVALILGFDGTRGVVYAAALDDRGEFKPNGWIQIDQSGTITLTIGKSEMGQGVRTSLAMILADELGADWTRIAVMQASPGPSFKNLGTGGSWSLGGSWKILRQAAASARQMLVTAAAAQWSVDRSECSAVNSAVVHSRTKRRADYGALVQDAAKLPVPVNPQLKTAADFSLIGRSAPRIDGPDIVTGKARYGIDARVPKMLHASVERPPWLGAKALQWREEKARAVRGVRAIAPISSGIAVIADSTWNALKGRAALAIKWSDRSADVFDSVAHRARLEKACQEEGIVTRKQEGEEHIEQASHTMEATYFYPFYAHAPVETMNCTASVVGDRCTIWAPTQAPNKLQEEVAELLAIPPMNVEVHVTLIGGGFGRRLGIDYALEAAEISRAVKAPVQVLWSRSYDMKHGHFQGASAQRLIATLYVGGNLRDWQ